MMRTASAALACLLVATPASATPSLQSQSDPYPGIHRELWTDTNVKIRVLRINLSSSEIALYATKEADAGMTTTDYAQRVGAQVAINGDSFLVNGYVPRGLAMGDSSVWSNTADDARAAVFFFRRYGERTVGTISGDSTVAPGDLPDGTEGVISGRPLLVRAGHVASDQINCADPISIDCQVAPRSALALSADGNTLWLVVVDGWQNASYGMTLSDLALFLKANLGAYSAMGLDGGSSSTLALNGSYINVPSDGTERRVANHLAVKYGSLPKGELWGLICKHSVMGCSADLTRRISGATVILDDLRTRTTGSTGEYDFLEVTPRYACVTVKKEGWLTVTQCRQVIPADLTYNSIALWEGEDPPDAGVGEDGGIGIDASTTTDAQTGDAGNGYGGPGPGCACNGGGDRGGVALWVVVAWFLRRRRGTTA